MLRFAFRSDLYFSNAGQQPSTLQVDFGDGRGYVAAAWNTPLDVTYGAVGTYDLQFRFGYPDGSTVQSHAPIQVEEIPAAARYEVDLVFTPPPITATRAFAGQPAAATLNILYGDDVLGNGARVLDKPLIVVEGYDPSNIVTDVPAYTFRSFIEEINEGQFILNDQLDLRGYDIVFVDFRNGVDFIQNNAYLLQEVIRWVNNNKTGLEPNVVLGQSMGGLVAQFALSDWEQNLGGQPHQVRLLITHDSPHRGANAPLAAQAAVRQLAGLRFSSPRPIPGSNNNTFALTDEIPELRQAYELLLAPASQQLLAYGTTGRGLTTLAAPVGSTLHDAFQTEYHNMPLPQGMGGLPCRVVANSNGAECARPQPYGPGARLATISGGNELFRFRFWQALGLGVLLKTVAFLPFIGAYDWSVDVRLNALPDQQVAPVYYTKLEINKRKRVLGIIPLRLLMVEQTVNSRSEMLPIDSAPGSTLGADLATTGLTPGSLPQGVSLGVGTDRFCFVPTPSALGVPLTGNSQVLYRSYSPSQRASLGTPYANVVTASRENLTHIQYDFRNSNWILNEVVGTPSTFDCLAFCQSPLPTIEGNASVCPGSTTTFQVLNLSPDATVTWGINGSALTQVSSNTGPSYTVQGASNGTATVTAQVTSACGNLPPLTRSVYVGPGQLTLGIRNLSNVSSCVQIFEVTARLLNTNAADLRWTVDGASVFGSDGQVSIQVPVEVNQPNVVVRATATPTCPGVPGPFAAQRSLSAGSTSNCPLRSAYTVYPNPADEQLAVEAEQPRATAVRATAPTGQSFRVQLHDGQGRPVRQQHTSTGRLMLDTRALPAGLYHLLIHDERGIERHHIQVQH